MVWVEGLSMTEENNNNNKAAPFLTDEPEEGVNYIEPNIEVKLSAGKRMECRNIVKEIKEFGINQRQTLYLIHLLALELENREVMTALTEAIGENREKVKISGLVLPGQEEG
jgi:hypothetical protein